MPAPDRSSEEGVRQRVMRLVRDNDLVRPGQRVLIACSGGVDSVTMTFILAQLAEDLQIELGVCSIDHGLRPESPQEVILVQRLADQLSLPFFTDRVVVETGDSLQAAARRARYGALFEVASAHGFDLIATGHTRDDQAETVLARIFRSGSLAGLTAISPKRNDGVIRPFLDCSRAMVMRYARRRGLVYCDDPSNQDARFERVRIRALLSRLREEEAHVDQRLADLATQAREQREAIERWAAEVDVSAASLARSEVVTLPAAVAKEVVARWVTTHCGRPLGSHMQKQAFGLIQRGKGELWLNDGVKMTVLKACVQLASRG